MPQANKPGNPFVDAPGNPFSSESGSEAFIKTAGRGAVNLALGLPAAAGEALALGAAGAETVAAGFNPLAGIPGQAADGPTFGERFQAQREKFPASMLRNFRPTVEGISAGVRSLPKLFPGGETFSESKQRLLEETSAATAQRKEKHPFAVGAGEVAGDVIGLVSGRAPFAKGINKLEGKLAGKTDDLFFSGAIPKLSEPGVRRFVNRVIDSKRVRLLARGAGRSLEAGFEAAVLDILKGDDPLETAGYAAGVQLGGSAVLTAAKGLLTGGPLKAGAKLALTAVSFGAILQLAKETVPGGEDNLISSIETGFEKVQLALILGLIGAAGGSGRLRGGKLAEDFPKLTDALAAIPRLSVTSLLEDFVNADPAEQQNIELVINKLTEDPTFFGKDITPKLQAAMENNRFADELRKLQNDRKFRQKLFSLQPPDLSDAK